VLILCILSRSSMPKKKSGSTFYRRRLFCRLLKLPQRVLKF